MIPFLKLSVFLKAIAINYGFLMGPSRENSIEFEPDPEGSGNELDSNENWDEFSDKFLDKPPHLVEPEGSFLLKKMMDFFRDERR